MIKAIAPRAASWSAVGMVLLLGCSSGGGGKTSSAGDGGAGHGDAAPTGGGGSGGVQDGGAGAGGNTGGNGGTDAAAGSGGAGGTDAAAGAGGNGSDAGDAAADGPNDATDASTVATDATNDLGTDASNDGAGGDVRETHAPGTFPDYESGSRLRARLAKTADGEKLWVGWQDSARGEPCEFSLAEDGKTRCLPSNRRYQAYFYADDKCTQPLLYGPSSCDTAAYLFDLPATCPSGYVAYKKDASVTPTKVYTKGFGGACAQSTASSGYAFATTVKVAASAFVAATEVRDTRGALEVRYYQADDGALETLGPYDPAAGKACGPFGAEVANRCVPAPTPSVAKTYQIYSDNKCTTTPMVEDYKTCGTYEFDPQGLVATYDDTARNCDGTVALTFRRLGPASAGGGAYQGLKCSSVYRGSETYLTYGAVVDINATTPALTHVDVGQGRVKVRYLATSTGQKLQASGFFDSTLGTTCSPASIDGTVRCVPDTAYSAEMFSDAECKTPVYAADTRLACAASSLPPFTIAYSWAADACVGTPHFYTAGSKITGLTSLTTNVSAGCFTSTDATPANRDVFSLVEKPMTDFATVTELVE